MNFFVADPEWGWWIILYFFLGGLAAGCYFVATLIGLFGRLDDRPLARIGYRLAFPLIVVCGVLLIVDLERPERFWHMVLQSERVAEARAEGWPAAGWNTILHALMLKWWSPMSIGAQALGIFGLCSFISLLGTFWPERWHAHIPGSRFVGMVFKILGCTVGFFIAAYTGTLLTATNQPFWSATTWIAPLFLTSAASTSMALLVLVEGRIPEGSKERLEKADLWAMGLELFVFLIFLASLGNAFPPALATAEGLVMVLGTLIIGLLLPLGLHLRSVGVPALARGDRLKVESQPSGRNPNLVVASVCALAGGLMLRYGVVRVAPALLAHYSDVDSSVEVPLARTWEGMALLGVTLILAVLIPYVLVRQWRLGMTASVLAGAVSLLVVAGVTLYAFNPVPIRRALNPFPVVTISPEDGRLRGGGYGAGDINRPPHPISRSKIPDGAAR